MLLAIDWTNIASTWWTRKLTNEEAIIGGILVLGYLIFVIVENFVKKDKK